MLSKAQISLINSLQHKKYRKLHNLFIVEGVKSVSEFANSSFTVDSIYATEGIWTKLNKIPHKIKSFITSDNEFKKISLLNNPQGVLALVQIPSAKVLQLESLKGGHTLLLDGIQDPGNMGTIIRTAEWFGMERIVCSPDCVDVYNPKVVQATMGSLSRLAVFYSDLHTLLMQTDLPSYGAVLNGESIYKTDFGTEGLIIMGNEGNGISEKVISAIKHPVTIPNFGKAESLNVAIATTVFCSELARKI